MRKTKCHTESSIAPKMRRDCAVTPCDNYVKIGEDKYIARQGISYEDPRDGIFYPPKFLILDKGEQSDIILYPNIIESKAYTLVYVAYSAEVKINPQKTKLVEALNYFDITNIIDTNTRKILGLKGKSCYDFDAWNEKGTDEDFVKKKLRVYTICANATEHYIILLQDRRLLSEIENGEPNSNPVLLFFDYNGDLIRELCLANDVIKIAYYEDGHTLYGVTSEEILLKYNLNGLI